MFLNYSQAISAGLDKEIKLLDYEKSKIDIIAKDDDTIHCIKYCDKQKVIITSNFTNKLKIWDIGSYSLLNIFSDEIDISKIAVCDNILTYCGSVKDKFFIKALDLRNTKSFIYENEIPVYITSISTQEDKAILGRIDGKLHIEYFSDKSLSYSFKGHKEENETEEIIYPVMSIDNKNNMFASGGSDKYVYLWDIYKRKKINRSKMFPESVSNLCFTDKYLAVASSTIHEDLNFDNSG
jgi:WD40 repeat protein